MHFTQCAMLINNDTINFVQKITQIFDFNSFNNEGSYDINHSIDLESKQSRFYMIRTFVIKESSIQ